jgi:hypothetical protein
MDGSTLLRFCAECLAGVKDMLVRIFSRSAAIALAIQAMSAALAQASPAATTSDGIFFAASTDYRSIVTPSYALGAHEVNAVTSDDAGPVHVVKPRVTGAGVQATLGLIAPPGSSLAAFGSNAKLALTGGYFEADGTSNGLAAPVFPAWVLLDGTAWYACDCITSQLTTKLSGWNVGLNASAEVRQGQVVWTPSFALVTASTRNRQTLVQADSTDLYNAVTQLRWNDVGLKSGLALSLPITPVLEWSFGGTLAVLYRHARLSGSDFLDVSGTDIGSSIALTSRTWALVPALQTQLTIRPSPSLDIAVFGSVEWDTRTPKIVAPSFADFPFGPSQSATLGFATQTSYRIGGSFTYAFSR